MNEERHVMGRHELTRLYCALCDLLEDSTAEERGRYRDPISNIKELINKRLNNERLSE